MRADFHDFAIDPARVRLHYDKFGISVGYGSIIVNHSTPIRRFQRISEPFILLWLQQMALLTMPTIIWCRMDDLFAE